jgi:hypothetical protein
MKVKVPYTDPKTGITALRDGTDVSFKPVSAEPWVEYELEDGTIIKLRQTLVKAIKIDGEFNPIDGSPIYTIEAQGNLSVGKKA